VWSEEGLGSTFTLRIPLAVEDTSDRPEPADAAHDAATGVLQEGRS
jgi:two-component system sensor histidine kinase SenX3